VRNHSLSGRFSTGTAKSRAIFLWRIYREYDPHNSKDFAKNTAIHDINLTNMRIF
jgi:hypothetical protein